MPIINSIRGLNALPEGLKPKVIELTINSHGGALNSCMHLIDIMNESEIPIMTVMRGVAMSCGLQIAMNGTKGLRLISETCLAMSHQFAGGAEGKEHELIAAGKSYNLTSQVMIRNTMRCSGKSEAYIKKHLLGASDVFMDPETVVKHGLADRVITY